MVAGMPVLRRHQEPEAPRGEEPADGLEDGQPWWVGSAPAGRKSGWMSPAEARSARVDAGDVPVRSLYTLSP